MTSPFLPGGAAAVAKTSISCILHFPYPLARWKALPRSLEDFDFVFVDVVVSLIIIPWIVAVFAQCSSLRGQTGQL